MNDPSLTAWEAGFIVGCQKRTYYTDAQKESVARMARKFHFESAKGHKF